MKIKHSEINHAIRRGYIIEQCCLTKAAWLSVQGDWLEKAGFPIGQRFSIQIKHGELIIKPIQ